MSLQQEVLVVEDDPDFRAAVVDALSDEGHVVAEATDGSTALAYLHSHPLPRLILLDWNMAPMNGAEFLEAISREKSLCGIPVVLMTAARRIEIRGAARRLAAHLLKPFDAEQLQQVVDRLCPH